LVIFASVGVLCKKQQKTAKNGYIQISAILYHLRLYEMQ